MQAREIEQLREQLTRAPLKKGPTLPPLFVSELNKALQRPHLTQWMRVILSNLKAYVRRGARALGEIPRRVEFNGQVANNMKDPGEQLAWRTWDRVNQSQTACAGRYVGSTTGTRQGDQQHATLEDATEAHRETFVSCSVKFRVAEVLLQWQTRQGVWIPVDSLPNGDCQRCTYRASPGGRHWHFQCPHSSCPQDPPPGHEKTLNYVVTTMRL